MKVQRTTGRPSGDDEATVTATRQRGSSEIANRNAGRASDKVYRRVGQHGLSIVKQRFDMTFNLANSMTGMALE